jgi:hypothetical protein
MFRAKTVLVLGAGASFEAGLPVGVELKNNISKLTRYRMKFGEIDSGDRVFLNEVTRGLPGVQVQIVISALSKISNGITYVSSVDNFLEVHRDDELIQKCAKAAISKEISDAERHSALFVDRSNIYNTLDTSRLCKTWHLELAHIALEKANSDALATALRSFSIISLNYDRCAEWFLFNALMGLYNLSSGDAAELLKNLRVIHPYGAIGSPSWSSGTEAEEFGPDMRGRLALAANRIKTFTEDVSNLPEVATARQEIEAAGNIVLLGFSFHPQNLQLLAPKRVSLKKARNVFGTTLGMSAEDTRVVQQELEKRFTAAVTLQGLSCVEYMRQFKRTLSG